MVIEITKLSSKGQIVIPLELRKKFNLEEGNLFAITSNEDMLCLRKIEMPKIKTWKEVVKPFRDAAKKSGFTKEDLDKVIAESKIK